MSGSGPNTQLGGDLLTSMRRVLGETTRAPSSKNDEKRLFGATAAACGAGLLGALMLSIAGLFDVDLWYSRVDAWAVYGVPVTLGIVLLTLIFLANGASRGLARARSSARSSRERRVFSAAAAMYVACSIGVIVGVAIPGFVAS